MSVIVVDLGNEKRDCMVSNAGWRDTVEVLRSLGLFDQERLELLKTAWLGQELTEPEARQVGEALVAGPLAAINWSDNVYPSDLFWSDPGKYKNDFAVETYWPSWLRAFASLCLSCKGLVLY